MKVEIDAASASAKHVRSLAWNGEADFVWRVWPREVLCVDFGSWHLRVGVPQPHESEESIGTL